MKNSSYLYHLNFYHGISNRTRGVPFSPPTQHRTVLLEKKSKHTRADMLEALCHVVSFNSSRDYAVLTLDAVQRVGANPEYEGDRDCDSRTVLVEGTF
jgi:hypothetical protein